MSALFPPHTHILPHAVLVQSPAPTLVLSIPRRPSPSGLHPAPHPPSSPHTLHSPALCPPSPTIPRLLSLFQRFSVLAEVPASLHPSTTTLFSRRSSPRSTRFDPFFVVADNASGITFSYDFPFLSSFSSPRSLEGGTVTVTGSNFGAKSLPSSVTIGSSACDHQAKVTGHTAFLCRFKRFSSNTSSSQGLYVNVSFGSIVISSTFNYDIPAITGLSPNRSTSGGTITISGTDFGKFYPPPQPELNPHALLPLQARPPTPGPSQSACRHAVQ